MMNRTRAILRCLVLLLFWLFSLHAISQVNLQAEYFIDSDPGYGLGFPINFTNASTIDSLEFNLNTTNLQSGYHTLYVRSQDNNGNWSLCNSVTFFKEKNFETNPLSQNAEFFIDIDPGIGQGQSISLPQGLQTAYKAFVINTATMSPGFHKLFVRGKDNKGNWGNCSYNVFYVDPFSDGLHNIAALEYFTDNDPGIGNAIPISISGNTADTSIVLPYNQTLFNKGFHRLYLRSFDSTGRSSLTNTTAFYVECLDTSLSQLKDAEYYFDTDPGFSQANFLGTIQNFNDSINTTISIASLQPGWHRLNIRARDHNNFWTHNLAYSFYKEILDTGLAAYEFFFDTDPGFSNADYGLFTPSNANDSAVFSLPVANLNNGFHNFFVRSKNNLGKWGVTSFTSFYKAPINQPLALISQSEYFIDTDPGFNNGTSVGFTHDSIVADYSTVLNTSGQEPGFHSLNFRFKDENGLWGHTNNLSFYIEATDTAINQSAEFFIDSDPGFGAANPVIANLISTNDSALFVVDASVFSIGSHNLFVRSKNSLGLWGLTNTDLFCRGTDADFIADSACFGDMTLFVNSTFGADTATVYQWDINNNGTVDFTTNDSVYYAFGQPGTHLVMLISDNPGACGDTILKEVFVRELPVPFIGNDTTICAHESHIFNAGNQWASYVWSNGSTTPQISVNTPGNYSVTITDIYNCEGADTAALQVNSLPELSGQVSYQNGFIAPGDVKMNLYPYEFYVENPLQSTLTGTNGHFLLDSIIPGAYMLHAELLHPELYPNVVNTYYDSTYQWATSTPIYLECAETPNLYFKMVEITPLPIGPYKLAGYIHYIDTTGFKTVGEPVPGAEVYVEIEPDDEPIMNVSTDTSGYYLAADLPPGSYGISVDITGIPLINKYHNIVLSGETNFITNLNFLVDLRSGHLGVYTNDASYIPVVLNDNISLTVYPNPFAEELYIDFIIKQRTPVSIRLFNETGKLVADLASDLLISGDQKLILHPRNYNLKNGVYFLSVQTKNDIYIKKLILVE